MTDAPAPGASGTDEKERTIDDIPVATLPNTPEYAELEKYRIAIAAQLKDKIMNEHKEICANLNAFRRYFHEFVKFLSEQFGRFVEFKKAINLLKRKVNELNEEILDPEILFKNEILNDESMMKKPSKNVSAPGSGDTSTPVDTDDDSSAPPPPTIDTVKTYKYIENVKKFYTDFMFPLDNKDIFIKCVDARSKSEIIQFIPESILDLRIIYSLFEENNKDNPTLVYELKKKIYMYLFLFKMTADKINIRSEKLSDARLESLRERLIEMCTGNSPGEYKVAHNLFGNIVKMIGENIKQDSNEHLDVNTLIAMYVQDITNYMVSLQKHGQISQDQLTRFGMSFLESCKESPLVKDKRKLKQLLRAKGSGITHGLSKKLAKM